MSDFEELLKPSPTQSTKPQQWFVPTKYFRGALLKNSTGVASLSGTTHALSDFYFNSELEAFQHLSTYYRQYRQSNPYLDEWENAVLRAADELDVRTINDSQTMVFK